MPDATAAADAVTPAAHAYREPGTLEQRPRQLVLRWHHGHVGRVVAGVISIGLGLIVLAGASVARERGVLLLGLLVALALVLSALDGLFGGGRAVFDRVAGQAVIVEHLPLGFRMGPFRWAEGYAEVPLEEVDIVVVRPEGKRRHVVYLAGPGRTGVVVHAFGSRRASERAARAIAAHLDFALDLGAG